MTVLHFYDGHDEILTSAWTARPSGGGTEVAFVWGASGISFFESATGVFRTDLDIPFADFARMVGRGGVVDLMHWSRR